jgi:6-phosphogluconolactonase (cycloisomerase 2 family)
MANRVTLHTAGLLLLASALGCGGGGSGGAPTSRARFAYVANRSDKTVTVYSVDQRTGALTVIPPALRAAGGVGPLLVVQNRYLYAIGPAWLMAFSIDHATGAFNSIAEYPIPNLGFEGLAASPDGQQVFVTVQSSVLAFQVGASGALTPVAGSPFSTSTSVPSRLSAAGPILLASGTADVFTMRSTAGVLSAPSIKSVTSAVWDFVGSPDGRHAYAADMAGHVTAYTVDLASGATTALAGTHTAGAYSPVTGALVHPSGKYLYVSNRGGDVTRFDISTADGALLQTAGLVTSPDLSENFEHLVTDPDGRFLYLTNNSAMAAHNFVLGFTIDTSTGALTQMPATFPTGGEPQGMAFVTD